MTIEAFVLKQPKVDNPDCIVAVENLQRVLDHVRAPGAIGHNGVRCRLDRSRRFPLCFMPPLLPSWPCSGLSQDREELGDNLHILLGLGGQNDGFIVRIEWRKNHAHMPPATVGIKCFF